MNKKWKVVGRKLLRRLPGMMTASGVALNGLALFSGIRATVKSVREVDAAELEQDRELEAEEKFKLVWKNYIPTVGEFVIANALIIGGAAMRNKENAFLMTACSIADMTLKEYKSKAVELLGEEKAEELEAKVIEQRLISSKEVKGKDGNKVDILETSEAALVEPGKFMPDPNDPIWFFEIYSGHVFKCTQREIDKAISECNKNLYNSNFVSINDFYWELGMKDINMGAMGDAFGWKADDGIIDVRYRLYDLNGVPCYAISFLHDPQNLYY